MVSGISYSIIFPGNEVRFTGLEFLRSFFLFSSDTFFPPVSLDTSPDCHDYSKILERPCKEVTLLPNGPAKGQKDGERTEASLWGGKAERAVIAQFGEEKAQEDPINVYKYLNRMSKRTGSVFFSVVPSDRMRGNGNGQEVSSGHQETLLHGEGYWALAQVLREVVQSSSLETLKSGMDTVLDNQLQVAMKRGIGRMTSRGPFQPQPFCDIIILPSRSWWTQLYLS